MKRNDSVKADKASGSYAPSLWGASPRKDSCGQSGKPEEQRGLSRDYGLNLDYSENYYVANRRLGVNREVSREKESLTYQRNEPQEVPMGFGEEIKRINNKFKDTDYKVEYYLRNSVNTDYDTLKRSRSRRSVYKDNSNNANVIPQECAHKHKSRIPAMKGSISNTASSKEKIAFDYKADANATPKPLRQPYRDYEENTTPIKEHNKRKIDQLPESSMYSPRKDNALPNGRKKTYQLDQLEQQPEHMKRTHASKSQIKLPLSSNSISLNNSTNSNHYKGQAVQDAQGVDANNTKVIELIERLNHFHSKYDIVREEKEELAKSYHSLKEEMKERNDYFLQEIQSKDQYIASLLQNQNNYSKEQYERRVSDYLNQIHQLKDELQLKDKDINQTLVDYQRDLQLLLEENEAFKSKLQASEQEYEQFISEIRRLNGLLEVREGDINALKSQLLTDNKEKEEQLRAFEIEKSDLLNKIAQLSNQETDNTQEIMNQCTELKLEKATLKKEIEKLQKQLSEKLSTQPKPISEVATEGDKELKEKYEKKSKELRETKEQYNALLKDYRKYQVTMVKKIEEMNNEINEEVKRTSEGIEAKFIAEIKQKELQVQALNEDLTQKELQSKNMQNEVGALKGEVSQMKEDKAKRESIQLNTQRQLEDQLNTLKHDYAQSKDKVKKLTEELSRLEADKLLHLNTIKELREHIENAVKTRKDDASQLKELNAKISSDKKIEEENKKLKGTITKLESDLKAYRDQFKDASLKSEQDNSLHQNEMNGLNHQLSQIKASLTQSNKQAEDLQVDFLQLKQQLTKEVKAKDSLQKEIAVFQKYNDDFSDEIDRQKQTITSLSTEKQQLTAKVAELNKDLKSKDSQIRELSDSVAKLAGEVAELTEANKQKEKAKQLKAIPKPDRDKELAEAQGLINQLKQDLDKLKNEKNSLETIKEETEGKMKNLQSTYDQLKFEAKYINEKEKKAQQEVLTCQQKVIELTSVITQFTEESTSLKEECASLKSTVDSLNAELSASKEKVILQKKENERVVLDMTSKLKRKSISEAENAKLTQEINSLKEELSALKESEIKLLKQQEQKVNQSSDAHQSALSDFKTQIDTLKLQLASKEEKLIKQSETTNKQIADLTEENKALTLEASLAKSYETQIQKLKTDKQFTFTQLKSQIDHNQELIAQLELKNSEIDSLKRQKEAEPQAKNVLFSSKESLGDDLLLISSSIPEKGDNETENLYKTIDQCKETILSLQQQIEEKDEEIARLHRENLSLEETIKEGQMEIEGLGKLNDKLIEKNNQLISGKSLTEPSRMPYQRSLTNVEDIEEQEDVESLHLTIANLRELIAQKDKEYLALQQELEREKEKEKEYAMRQSEPSLSKISSSSMTDAEKCLQYKKRLEEYRATQKSEQELIAVLKNEIREMKEQLKAQQSFEGKISSYEEFIKLYTVAFENYKPKKKEQEEAFKRLGEHLAGYNEEVLKKTHNKGLFNKLFK